MNINTDSLVPFILMWGIPAFIVVRAFLKLDMNDKKSAISEFKSWGFILTIGFIVAGAFLVHVGILFVMRIIEVIGFIFFSLGGIFTAIDMFKRKK
ncbi:hypothetical protein [Metabacillus halosaccharovorans]|uniref:hypothetical protein n=1 Tax=Metabacillus halosaccharovorans TaxID=930124 RepID=UPI00203E4171|nr:hypothetical protein [Metabacillus halosaccharovorans]MCM3442674.1 hypothetical protein [Metabacillus halosaccharovorans]